MTRARNLSRLGNSDILSIDSSNNVGIGSTIPDVKLDVIGDAEISGVITATSFSGSGSGLTGVASTDNIITSTASTMADIYSTGIITATTFVGALTGNASGLSGSPDITINNLVGVAATFSGVVTYEDVTNVDSLGIVTARGGIEFGAAGVGGTITSVGNAEFAGVTTSKGNLNVGSAITAYAATGIVSATAFYGDGAALSGVVSGIEVKSGGSSVGTSLTALNFSGATVTTASSGITTITISAGGGGGISTAAGTSAGIVTTLYLSDAQDHKMTASGITTITCSGGSEGESHTVRITNSGITTVGFSTYFLWPSGAAPSIPTTSGTISLISFTVHRVGAGGTQLLAGASLNFS